MLSVMFTSDSLRSQQWGGFYGTHPGSLQFTTLHGSLILFGVWSLLTPLFRTLGEGYKSFYTSLEYALEREWVTRRNVAWCMEVLSGIRATCWKTAFQTFAIRFGHAVSQWAMRLRTKAYYPVPSIFSWYLTWKDSPSSTAVYAGYHIRRGRTRTEQHSLVWGRSGRAERLYYPVHILFNV